MNSILSIINSINNINKSIDNYNNLSTLFVNNNVNKKNNIMSNIENLCEYVDNQVKNINNINYMYNNGKTLENINNVPNTYFDNIHNENISNIANTKDFYTDFVDKSENSVDKVYYPVDNLKFFHNNSDFKEIYNYVDNLSNGDTITTNSNSNTKSNININMGGITQNITEANCDTVLDELSNTLLRALNGCDGIY